MNHTLLTLSCLIFPITGCFANANLSLGSYEVVGEGYIRLQSGEDFAYLRGGNFITKDGAVVHTSGWRLTPPVYVPQDATSVYVLANGHVKASTPAGEKAIGLLTLALFPSGTKFQERNGLMFTNEKPKFAIPSTNGSGSIRKVIEIKTHATENKNRVVPNTGKPRIELDSTIEVRSTVLTLNDIAKISAEGNWKMRLEKVSLGASPKVGSDRVCTLITLHSALRASGIDVNAVDIHMPERVVIKRASRILSAQELERYALEQLQEKGLSANEYQLQTNVSERRIADGDVVFKTLYFKGSDTNIVMTIAGSVQNERQFTQQLVFVKNSVANLNALKTGQVVPVVLVSNAITVTTQGVIRSISSDGTITVLINETKAILTGTYKQDGTVEVKL